MQFRVAVNFAILHANFVAAVMENGVSHPKRIFPDHKVFQFTASFFQQSVSVIF